MSSAYIKLKGISKQYPISVIDTIITLLRAVFMRQKMEMKRTFINALSELSLTINEGERVGVIGKNGAGKSTLLQIISGVLSPTKGEIDISGSIASILTLGTMLREDLTGRENIFLDAETQGLNKNQILRMMDKVISFADIGEFIDRPVRTYSTGMKARLAFSMLLYVNADIIIIDEIFSVGDVRFMQKSFQKTKEICQKGKITIIVSHSMEVIKELCNRCIWIDKGRIIMDGDPDKVTTSYLDFTRAEEEEQLKRRIMQNMNSNLSKPIQLRRVRFMDTLGRERLIFNIGEKMVVEIEVANTKMIRIHSIEIIIKRADDILIDKYLYFFHSRIPHNLLLSLEFEKLKLGKGFYLLVVVIKDENEVVMLEETHFWKIENPLYGYENPIVLDEEEIVVKVV